MLSPDFLSSLGAHSAEALWLVGGLALVGMLSFLRLFWSLFRREVRFDLRIVEFGFQMFLLGAVVMALAMVWLFRAYLF